MMTIRSPRVPSEYREIEWLGMNYPNQQWIEVPTFRFNSNNSFEFEFEADFIDTSYNYNSLWCYSKTSNGQESWTNGGALKMDTELNDYTLRLQIPLGDVTRGVVVQRYDAAARRSYMTFSHDGVTESVNVSTSGLGDGYLVVGAYMENTASKTRFYSFRIRENGALTYDFVPVKRKSDDIVGFFDAVSRMFYTNDGYGAFLAGDEIVTTEAVTVPQGSVRSVSVGVSKVWSRYIRLPEEYREVEYVSNETGSGTNMAHIDTEYLPTTNYLRFEIDFMYLGGNMYSLCGAAGNNDQNFAFQYWSAHLFVGTSRYLEVGEWVANTKSKTMIDIRNGEYTSIHDGIKNTLSYSGNLWKQTSVGVLGTKAGSSTWHDRTTPYRLYSFRLWDNDALVRHMVPCYRVSDNVIGMYDLVEGAFHGNAGSGPITKGNDV